MKRRNSIWGLWLGLGILAAFLILIPFISGLLVLGQQLAHIHAGLDWALYAVLLLLLYLLAVRPVILVLFAPSVFLSQLTSLPYKTQRKVAERLCENGSVTGDAALALSTAIGRKALLEQPLLDFIAQLDETARQKIEERAILAFVSNTIVQNGRLEAVALLSINIRLVHDLVNHYGFRPSLPYLFRIYGEVFVTAFLVDEVNDLDLDSALSMCVSPALAAIPGFHLITHSLLQGATSSLFTLRIGLITRDILKDGIDSGVSRRQRRQMVNGEAAKRALAIIPTAMSELGGALMKGKIGQFSVGTEERSVS